MQYFKKFCPSKASAKKSKYFLRFLCNYQLGNYFLKVSQNFPDDFIRHTIPSLN